MESRKESHEGSALEDSTGSTITLDSGFSCDTDSDSVSDSGDKELFCNNDMNIAYRGSSNSLCRMDDVDGIVVSTCMEGGERLRNQTCEQGGESIPCPELNFSCEVSNLSTSDNWMLSCDDHMGMSMDMSSGEMCAVDLNDGEGSCLDSENEVNNMPIVWKGYVRDSVEMGEDVLVEEPMWVSNDMDLSYSATPAGVCSVQEDGILEGWDLGICRVEVSAARKNLPEINVAIVNEDTKQDGDLSCALLDDGQLQCSVNDQANDQVNDGDLYPVCGVDEAGKLWCLESA